MTEELRSFLIGTIPLDIVMIVALVLTVSRGPGKQEGVVRAQCGRVAALATAVQIAHFVEEWATGFNCRFPELLGLEPWSPELWVSFNLAWIFVWVVSILGVRAGVHAALFPIWFLGIASVLNGIAHPLLAAAVAGYFPGLWTSPVAGVTGVRLVGALGKLTDSEQVPAQVT
jgi:hypothetical protein